MSTISVKWQGVNSAVSMYGTQRRELSDVLAGVRSIKSYRCMRGGNFNAVYAALDRVISRMEKEKSDIQSLENGLKDVLKVYQDYENKIAGQTKAEQLREALADTERPGIGGTESEKDMDFDWSLILKLISKAGIVGSGASALGKLLTSDWSLKTGLSIGKDLVSMLGGISGTLAKGADANWKEALFGLSDALSGVDISSAGKAFTSSWAKQFGKDLSFKGVDGVWAKGKVLAKWAGHALTFITNGVDNYEEHGGFGARWAAETLIESGVDIALGAAATAGITALAAAAGFTAAPVVVVGAAAVGVTWAANGLCKWVTGQFGEAKDLGEVASDLICDTAEWIGDKAKSAKDTLTKWGKALFG